MARRFGAASTDAITSGLTTHATQRTYAIWARRTGGGGGNLGSMFRKRTVGAADILQLYYDGGAGQYIFQSSWTTGGIWQITAPSANDWWHVLWTYNAASSGNLPICNLNGAGQPVGTLTGATGSVVTNTDPFVIGNRTNDNARNWAGDLAEFCVWNTVLTQPEAYSIYLGTDPRIVQTTSLVLYMPLANGDSPEPDQSGNGRGSTAISGTTWVDNPPGRSPNAGFGWVKETVAR